jgi:hypothetical protein
LPEQIRNIVVVLCISFFIVFTSLFLLADIFPTPDANVEKNTFFTQKFDPTVKRIFILGSSQTAVLNTTRVIEGVTKSYPEYMVYNLGYDTDNPKKRLNSLQETMRMKPSIVLYGISFRDFIPDYESKNYFDIQQIKKLPQPDVSINPKLITLKVLKSAFGDNVLVSKSERKIIQPNTPFTETSQRGTIIVDDIEIRKQLAKEGPILIKINAENERVENLKRIITQLKQNHVKVILFTTPLPKIYLDSIPDAEKNELHNLLNEIADEFDIKTYDLTASYEELGIWSDLAHVALNPKSIIYSDDIAGIIVKEIETNSTRGI